MTLPTHVLTVCSHGRATNLSTTSLNHQYGFISASGFIHSLG